VACSRLRKAKAEEARARHHRPPLVPGTRPASRREAPRRSRPGSATSSPSRCAYTSATGPSPAFTPHVLYGDPSPRAQPGAPANLQPQKAVNSRLGRADNERFLEHFRYLLVASQLLGGQDSLRTATIPGFAAPNGPGLQEFKVAAISTTGATLTGATAFLLVWLVHWSRRQPGVSKGRWLLVLAVTTAVATAVYGYMRRQWLQYLRQDAVEGASAIVTNLQAFEASTSSALAFIQEVELVSRGYRL
jgi:hypothetical protein